MLFPSFHLSFVVILDSGFCALKGIVELHKKGVFASALIKKRRYWLKYIHGDEVKEHFNDRDADSWSHKLEDVPFHVFTMKELDYVMSLMSTYRINAWDGYKEMQHEWQDNGTTRTKSFCYPEVVHNHFQIWHSVDDHNAKQHSPISIEVVWATKRWPNHVFDFLLSITEVKCFLAESYFTSRKTESMIDFRKDLAHQLIENKYLAQEIRPDHHQLVRIQLGISHRLLSLPPFKFFEWMDGQFQVTLP